MSELDSGQKTLEGGIWQILEMQVRESTEYCEQYLMCKT